MPVNHTVRCSAQIEFYRVRWLVYWMGYDVGGASVMDYQALFQESIQQETLQEKHLGVSFKPARTPPAWRRKAHPPVTGCSHIHPNVIQSQSRNWIVLIYLFSFFYFPFFIRLEYESRIKTAYRVKDLFTAAILIAGRTAWVIWSSVWN